MQAGGQGLDVLAVGNINVDLSFFVDAVPGPDSEAEADDFAIFQGGSAANFSVGAARLGLRSGILACVGNDPLGKEAIRALSDEGVSVDYIRIDRRRTGTVCVIVEKGGGRRFLAYRGANEALGDAVRGGLPGSRILQICNVSREVLGEARRRGEGRTVSFDPGGGAMRLRPEDVEGVDILLLNEVECMELTGMDYRRGAQILSSYAGTVVVKLGPRGALMRDGGKEYHHPALVAEAVDTTGAGDAFNAGFIAALAGGMSRREGLTWGSVAAALKIRSRGARNGLPTREELCRFLDGMGRGGTKRGVRAADGPVGRGGA